MTKTADANKNINLSMIAILDGWALTILAIVWQVAIKDATYTPRLDFIEGELTKRAQEKFAEQNPVTVDDNQTMDFINNYLDQEDSAFLGFMLFVPIVLVGIWSGAAVIGFAIFGLIIIMFTGFVSWINLTFVIAAALIGLVIAALIRK